MLKEKTHAAQTMLTTTITTAEKIIGNSDEGTTRKPQKIISREPAGADGPATTPMDSPPITSASLKNDNLEKEVTEMATTGLMACAAISGLLLA